MGGETTKCKVPPQQVQLDPVEKMGLQNKQVMLHLYIIILYSYNLGCPPFPAVANEGLHSHLLLKAASKHRNDHGGDCLLGRGATQVIVNYPVYIPRTQMTLVLIGKGLVSGG